MPFLRGFVPDRATNRRRRCTTDLRHEDELPHGALAADFAPHEEESGPGGTCPGSRGPGQRVTSYRIDPIGQSLDHAPLHVEDDGELGESGTTDPSVA